MSDLSPDSVYTVCTPSPSEWDHFVDQHPRAHILQTSAWGALKSAYEWDCVRVALREGGDPADDAPIVAGAQLLFKRLPLRLGTMAYLPMGAYVSDGSQWEALWSAIDACARDHNAAFLKWEPGILEGGFPPAFEEWGFRESAQTIQPPRTILLDISQSDDEILAHMNQGTRRKIRQSLKNDVRYYEGTRADLAKFTALMHTTGTRNAFGVHEPAYYEQAYDLFVPRGDAALILAEHDGDTLAGVLVFAKHYTTWYLYGASSDHKRNLMASYGVQWSAIQWAKRRGCDTYDFWGIPDEDADTLEAEFEQRSDGLWGVYGFKRGWGGHIVRSEGAWDRVYNPLIYGGYQLAVTLRD